ncbi:MAG: hypothetical protein ABJB93_05960 [Gaiellales bacterium]
MGQRLALTVALAVVGIGGSTGQALAANPYPPTAFWQTNGTVRAIAFRGNVVYVGGEFTSVRPPGAAAGTRAVTRHNVAAFNTKTGAVLKWNPGANGTVRTIVVTSTRVYLGGSFTTVDGRARANVAAVSLGGVVSKWNPGANRSVFVLRLGPNGQLFAGGDFTKIGGKVRRHLAEIGRSASAPIAAWGPAIGQITGFACPPRCSPRVFSIAFSGHRVYFGGHFGLVDGVARNEAAAVPIDNSSQVLAFNPNIYAAANCPTCTTVETSRVYRIIATSSHIYTCGGYWKVNGTKTSYNVSAFDPNTGTLQNSLTQQDDGDTPGCMLRAGVLYVGGHFNVAGPGCTPGNLAPCSTRHHVAAFNTTDNTLLPWNPGANSDHGLLVIASGAPGVGFGGYFTRMGGTDQQGFSFYRSTRLPNS